MSLLSYIELCELVEQGVITNVKPEAINAASIDIHLGPIMLVEAGTRRVINYRKREPMDFHEIDLRKKVEGWGINPNEFVLAQSIEVFNLPNNISAQYQLKSSMARIGLDHAKAGWADAGWNGSVLTLELKNASRFHTIRLQHGDPIGQMVFFRHAEVPADRSYAARGRYNSDLTAKTIKE